MRATTNQLFLDQLRTMNHQHMPQRENLEQRVRELVVALPQALPQAGIK